MTKALIFTKNDGYYFHPQCLNHAARYDGPLFNSAHGLRPPVGIINIALEKVISATTDALTKLEMYRIASGVRSLPSGDATTGNSLLQSVVDSYARLIAVVDEYSEDIQSNLVKSLIQNPDADKKIKRHVKLYRDKIKPLRAHAATINNALKHAQNTLNFSVMRSSYGNTQGYTVCNTNERGALCPNPNVHGKIRVFSFNIDIRRLICDVYAMGYEAGKFIEEIANLNGAFLLRPHQEYELKESPKLNAVLTSISQLPILGFPNEKFRPLPIVQYDEQSLHIAPHGGTHIQFFEHVEITYTASEDGVTKTFEMP